MRPMKKLPLTFFLRDDVVLVARELLGKVLVTAWNGVLTSGRIVETEAYAGETDKASHASRGKTKRTGILYREGGIAYIYLCYGIHQMFNIVTNTEGIPHAVLIRGVAPIEGIDVMLQRTGKRTLEPTLTRGPGNVGKAFGFHTSQCGQLLGSSELYIADDGYHLNETDIAASSRIGVAYAGEHALWQYRFYIRGNSSVSGSNS